MKSAKFLEDYKQVKGLKTDKDLAEALGVTKAAISQYKSGTRIMENETCLAVALELGIDPMRIIMAADIDRAERNGQHSLWEVFTRRTGFAASVLVGLLATNFLSPQPAEAASRLASQQNQEVGVRIMLNKVDANLAENASTRTTYRNSCEADSAVR